MNSIAEWDIPDDKTLSGVAHGIGNEEYHSHPSISKSGLDAMAKSPAHYKTYLRGGQRTETPAMKQGTLIHCAVLEPDHLARRYYAMPDKIDRRTKSGKAAYDEAIGQAGNRIIITSDEMLMAERIRRAVGKHRTASQLFDGGIPEVSVFSRLSDVGVRCRPDYLHIEGGLCIDVKSTDDASPNFIKSVMKWRYHVQHPFYLDVMAAADINIDQFLFVAIEKQEPHGIGIYELDGAAVECGRREYQANLDTYRRCLESGAWPCYHERITTLSLPGYVTCAD